MVINLNLKMDKVVLLIIINKILFLLQRLYNGEIIGVELQFVWVNEFFSYDFRLQYFYFIYRYCGVGLYYDIWKESV